MLGAQASRLQACASTLNGCEVMRACVSALDLFALARSWQAGRLRSQHLVVLLNVGRATQAREGDAEVAAEEVAEGGAEERSACGPRAALQHTMVAIKPDL